MTNVNLFWQRIALAKWKPLWNQWRMVLVRRRGNNAEWKNWSNLNKSQGYFWISRSEQIWGKARGYGSAGDLVPRLPPPAGQGGEGQKQRSGCHHKRSLSLSHQNFYHKRWNSLSPELRYHQNCFVQNCWHVQFWASNNSDSIATLLLNCFQKLIWFYIPVLCRVIYSANPDWKVPVERRGLGSASDCQPD